MPRKLPTAVAEAAVLPAGKDRHTIYDTEVDGFSLRLSAGSKAWFSDTGRGVAAGRRINGR
jgi:hypothetical protein